MDTKVGALSKELLEDYFIKVKVFPDPVVLEERVNKLSENACFIITRDDEDTIVGLIAYYMNRAPLCYITHVSVVEEYQRRGIASTMLSLLEREAREYVYSLIKLEVKKENLPAIRLYEKAGYHIVGESGPQKYYMLRSL